MAELNNGKKKRGRGRPPGSKNKKTLEIQARLESEDPIGKLLELAEDTEDEDLRAKVLLGILPYGYARLAASTVDLKAALIGDLTLEVNLSEPKD